MKEGCVLALDQGTTSSRAILFDHAGRALGSARREFRQFYPKPGWVEHDAVEIWASQSAALTEAVARAGVDFRQIAAVGLTNQRETVVVWERATGRPIHPAIVWQDRRTAERCRQMQEEGLESLVREKTGLLLDPYFSATKLQWILENVKGARAQAEKGELAFGTIDSWLLWKLSRGRVHATDTTNACRTLLYNIHTLQWDDELLQCFAIPRQILPEVKPSSGPIARIDPRLFPGELPITGVAGDQHAALFGQACYTPGMAKSTYGTGSFLLMHTGEQPIPSPNRLLSTLAWQIGDRTEYALEGSVFIAGAVVQWLRDELGLIRSAGECDELAAGVSDSGGLFLVPAFAGLGAPHWDPFARGLAIGITRGINRAHFCRAALEAIAFQTADLVAAMEKDAQLPLAELRVDGGVANSEPLLQFQADLLQRPVVRPQCIETTALGAAYLAGLAVGFWENRSEIVRHWQEDRRLDPLLSAREVKSRRHEWNRAVLRSRSWAEPDAD